MVEQIGNYIVKGQIGEGGMGRVYRAHDPSLDLDVAIKVLTTEGDTDLLGRFRSEAETTAKLRHKNIVRVYAYGEQDGRPYLVMEYLEGKTLQEVIKHPGSLTLLDKVRIVNEAAQGLLYAHSKNIIHRDIKPANIMLLPDGTVKIMDFGIARVTGRNSTRKTSPGFMLGTISYMAPEQLRSGADADSLADIFAFGDVIYELLTGVHPFRADDWGTIIFRITSADPPPIRELAPEVPEELAFVVQQALAKEPEVRYQSLRDMLLDTEPILARLRQEQATATVTGALTLVDEGRLEEAMAAVRQALEMDPLNEAGRQLREELRNRIQKKIVRVKIDGMLQTADEFAARRCYTDAVQVLEKALSLDKFDEGVVSRLEVLTKRLDASRRGARLFLEARRDVQQGNLTGAYWKASEAVQTDPENNDVAGLLKQIQTQLDDRELERARKAIREADFLAAIGKFDEALALIEEVANVAIPAGELQGARDRVEQARAQQEKQELNTRLNGVRDLLRDGRFQEAGVAMDKLQSELAGSRHQAEFAAPVAELQELIAYESAFDAASNELIRLVAEQRWKDASRKLTEIQDAFAFEGRTTGLVELLRESKAADVSALSAAVRGLFDLREYGEAARVLADTQARLDDEAEWQALRRNLERRREYERQLDEARRLESAGDLAGAETLLRSLTATESPDARAEALLDVVLEAIERKRREEAERARLKAEAEAREAARLEAERKAKEEAERARLQAEAEAREAARLEAERKAKEEAERARLKAEAEAREAARLEAERKAKEEAEAAAREAARLEVERKAKEEAERARLKAEAEAREVARLEAERKAKEEAERTRREAARLEAERKAKEETERTRLKAEAEAREAARIEAERKAKEEAERARVKAEAEAREAARLEAERKAKEETERTRLKAEAEAREAARIEAEREAKEEAERARLKAEAEAREAARLEAERTAKEEAERVRVKAEAARLESERKAKEEAERSRREADARQAALLESERKAKEEAERARLKAEAEARETARLESERKAKADVERKAKEEAARLEAERKQQEKAERARQKAEAAAREAARLEAERKAKEEAERVRLKAEADAREAARLEAERRAKEEAERKAKEEAGRARLKAEAEALAAAKREADRKAKEEAERKQREADRKRKEEAERARAKAEAEAREAAKRETERKQKEDADRARRQPAVPMPSPAPPPVYRRPAAIAAAGVLAVVGGYFLLHSSGGSLPDPPVAVKLSRTEVTFRARQGTPVEAQVIDYGDAAVGYDATTTDPRIKVTPTGGDRLAKLTVSADTANLNPGVYDFLVNLKWRGGKVEGPSSIPVHLIVEAPTGPPVIAFRPKQLDFAFRVGDAAPAAQSVSVEGAPADTLSPTLQFTGRAKRWATLDASATGLRVAIQPSGLTVGNYSGFVQLRQTDKSDAGRIPISLSITPAFSSRPSNVQEQLRWTGTLAPKAVLSIQVRTCSTGELSAGELPASPVNIDEKLISAGFKIEAKPSAQNGYTLRIRNISDETQNQLTVFYREVK